jgi:hypothetical protein
MIQDRAGRLLGAHGTAACQMWQRHALGGGGDCGEGDPKVGDDRPPLGLQA